MIISKHPSSWQQALKEAITDPAELLRELQLEALWLTPAEQASLLFPLKVPRSFVARMRVGDPHDPLLKQVLPVGAELVTVPGYTLDPLAELNAMPVPGLLHKYPGRVLLTATGACAVNCRYCFRRHFPYQDSFPLGEHWSTVLHYIAQDSTIQEVIFSGGDPLVLKDEKIHYFIKELSEIPHLKTVRFHTRFPVVIPERITETLLKALKASRLHPVVVIHVNHPNEIDLVLEKKLRKMSEVGITLLNQSVLLKGVNDQVNILHALSWRLFEASVLPYYLNVFDKVQSAAHFDLPLAKAKSLHQKLRASLSGYLVPKLVIEVPGALFKKPVE